MYRALGQSGQKSGLDIALINFKIFADTADSRRIHHPLRYQVYCLEQGYEDPNSFERDMKFDEHDHRTLHFIVRCRVTDQWVAELSRVCVAKPFRSAGPSATEIKASKRRQSEILFGICRAAGEAYREYGVDNLVVFVAQAMSRILTRCRVPMHRIGSTRLPQTSVLRTAAN
ncbi:MAG TPA: GNAT family N-acetyltransferase [Chromatiaceae bacterium]|nr:GNAT family N-acetyltransferase [Chromatiaceae bacterium]HIN82993.1 GNAT family N-acetyltransferase [Chromatiales bacterium]